VACVVTGWCGVWSALLFANALANHLGAGGSFGVAFAAIACVLLVARWRNGAPRLGGRKQGSSGGTTLAGSLGVLAGYASYPAWVATIYPVGQALGLRAVDFPVPWTSPALWVAAILLAPIWEELLYRERMLLAFRSAWGVVPSVVLSSAAFALPHAFGGGPWALLGTFLAGLALAGVALVSRWIWLCVAIHAGLNLGALAWSFGPAWASLPPWASALAGWVGLGAALVLLRRGRRRGMGPVGAMPQAAFHGSLEADSTKSTTSTPRRGAPASHSAITSHPEPT